MNRLLVNFVICSLPISSLIIKGLLINSPKIFLVLFSEPHMDLKKRDSSSHRYQGQDHGAEFWHEKAAKEYDTSPQFCHTPIAHNNESSLAPLNHDLPKGGLGVGHQV